MEENLTDKRGIYSGNRRLDTTSLEEPDLDTPQTWQLWMEDVAKDPDFSDDMKEYLEEWKEKVSISMDPSQCTFHILGQTHIDMAWKWRYEQTKKKAIKTYSKLIKHIEYYNGNLKFAASEPQLLQWIKEDEPSLWEKIKENVEKGIIEPVGGSWVEPDCMMPSGESMVRQRLYGMRFYKDEFGRLPKVEWFLDSFGYNAGLPQILKKSGAEYFWTNKMTWNDTTLFPFVYFLWESPDGTKLLTANFGQNKETLTKWEKYHLGRHLIEKGKKKVWTYKEGYSNFNEVISKDEYVNAIGYFMGKGNGGHGPTHQEMVETQMAIKTAPEVGLNLKWSTAEDFFKEVAKNKKRLPIWADEMYLEFHRGTFSNHSEVKRYNRKFENELIATEMLATLLALHTPRYKYPTKEIEQAWKTVLLNQFHDVLPGSSIPEVYDDLVDMWKEVQSTIDGIKDEISQFIKTSGDHQILLFNPVPWARNARIFIAYKDIPNVSLDTTGRPPYARIYINSDTGEMGYICQPVAAEPEDKMDGRPAGWWTIIPMEGLALIEAKMRIELVHAPTLPANIDKEAGIARLANGIVSAEFSLKNGALIGLKMAELNNDRNLVEGEQSFLITGYKDHASQYPAWNLQKDYWKEQKKYEQNKNLKIEIEDQGPIFTSLKISKKLGISNSVQRIRLFKDDPMVYCMWSSDWQEPDVLLKWPIYTSTEATEVTVDNMYCVLKESTLPKSEADKARFEKIMHKFVDISTPKNRWGIALINEGKYAFDASGGRLRLSLHRSPEYPQPAAEAWVNLERKIREEKEGTKPPTHSGIGPISARFAFLPHRGGALKDSKEKPTAIVRRAAEEYNQPIQVIKAKHNEKAIKFSQMEFYFPENVQMTTMKFEEWEHSGHVIFRFAETGGISKKQTNIIVPTQFAKMITEIEPIDLLERPIQREFQWDAHVPELIFPMDKFEIVSFRIKLKSFEDLKKEISKNMKNN